MEGSLSSFSSTPTFSGDLVCPPNGFLPLRPSHPLPSPSDTLSRVSAWTVNAPIPMAGTMPATASDERPLLWMGALVR